MEYPDHPGATRTGVACPTKKLDGIVMYRDTRTGVAVRQTGHGLSSTTVSRSTDQGTLHFLVNTDSILRYEIDLNSSISRIISVSPKATQTRSQSPPAVAKDNTLSRGTKIALGICIPLLVGVVFLAVLYTYKKRKGSRQSAPAPPSRGIVLSQAPNTTNTRNANPRPRSAGGVAPVGIHHIPSRLHE
jgi:hypothetical protein